MIIIEDSKEQTPLDFSRFKDVEYVMRASLDHGDYACVYPDGTWCKVIFDRKEHGDLFGTLGKDIKRFKSEINRSKEHHNLLVIIVEKPLKTIAKGYRYSKMKGIAVVRTLFTLMFKHYVPFVLCSNRGEMELYIIEAFSSWGKLNGNNK